MFHKSSFWVSFLLICLLLVNLACNFTGSSEPEAATPNPPAETVTQEQPADPDPTATAVADPSDPLAVNTLQDVKLATIQIEAQGTFVDPQVGLQMNVPGRGSGFIIDESGIAVTNNHVVTGAGLLRVWVGGESQPRNARVLAVSECSDLAVIDLEDDGYRYLEWYDGSITPGLDVYAAGFPLGDPEYTLTRGIVSKEQANGESDWASVDSVIEHDATINPGNSGGPLVTPDGKIVAVNYAGSQDTNQYFAISKAEVVPLVEEMIQERDVTSLGVNGLAINDGEGLSGIWVSSVESGSPADQAGIEGGDIITLIEDIPLATDGTMADYCDILRSHGANDTLSVQVLRYDTEEVLEGQINGTPLAQAFSFAQALGDEVANTPPSDTNNDSGAGNANPAYTDYVSITDDSGSITMEVPAEWGSVDGSLWEVDGEVIGASLVAASNLDDFYNAYDTPGVVFFASEAMAEIASIEDLLALGDSSTDCVYEGRYDYEDALYTGAYDLYNSCGGSDSILVILAAFPDDNSYATLLIIQAVSDADLTAVDHIMDTFVVVDELPGSTGNISGSSGGGTTDVTLEVVNDMSQDIWYIYISPSNSDSWGEDWLGDDTLPANSSYYFTLSPGTYDLAAYNTDHELMSEEMYGVDLSSDQTWTIYMEGDDDMSGSPDNWATLEVVNEANVPIWYIFISPSTSDDWGEDWLDDMVLFENDSYTFTLPPDTYDLKAIGENDAIIEEQYQVEIIGEGTWTINGDNNEVEEKFTLTITNLSTQDVCSLYLIEDMGDRGPNQLEENDTLLANTYYTITNIPLGSRFEALALGCDGSIVGQNLDGFYFDKDLEWTIGQ
jgi:serine protease Do